MRRPVLEQLAHAMGQRDEQPNIDLAIRIAQSGDDGAVAELMSLLLHKKNEVAHDAIKAIYETGERRPELIAPYVNEFLQLLRHKNNRMKWGAMCALSAISAVRPEAFGKHIVPIVEAMDEGTVITRDHGITILANLARLKKYHVDAMALLLEQLEKAPVNQFPMYAEKIAPVLSPAFKAQFLKIIRNRTDVLEVPSKKKRIDKLLKSLSAKA